MNKSLFMIFSVVDVETTGGRPEYDAITEIAIVKTDGKEILATLESLVNPETNIPRNISHLTGITNDMVDDQPVFGKLSDEIFEFLKGSIFVAHNVHFDYGFVRNGLRKSGIDLNLNLLCSVQYARRVFPGLPSYSLGAICKQLGIINSARHRALGDAMATAELLKMLIHHDPGLKKLKLQMKRSHLFVLPPHVHEDLFNKIPHSAGVYRFLNKEGKPIYIGKAKDLKSRVRQHFTENGKSKFTRFRSSEIYDISWTETGTDLVAQILEDSEIRQHWPIYNKAQKYQSGRYRIIYYQDQSGNYRLGVQTGGNTEEVLFAFDSMSSAKNQLLQLVNEYQLNSRLCNVFHYNVEEVSLQEHNERCEDLINRITGQTTDLFVLDRGRAQNELSIILLRNRRCLGFAFVKDDHKISTEYIEGNLIPVKHSTYIDWVINSFVLKNPERCKTKNEIESKALII